MVLFHTEIVYNVSLLHTHKGKNYFTQFVCSQKVYSGYIGIRTMGARRKLGPLWQQRMRKRTKKGTKCRRSRHWCSHSRWSARRMVAMLVWTGWNIESASRPSLAPLNGLWEMHFCPIYSCQLWDIAMLPRSWVACPDTHATGPLPFSVLPAHQDWRRTVDPECGR